MEFYGTMGPSCCTREVLTALFEAGMTGMRLNLSHGGLEGCTQWLEAFRQASAGRDAQLLIDLQGPEMRSGNAAPLSLPDDALFEIGAGESLLPGQLFDVLEPGQALLLDDGAIKLRVLSVKDGTANCLVERGGRLLPRKSIAAPGIDLHLPTLTQEDRKNIALAVRSGVTGVMLPFVRSAEDLLCLRETLEAAGAGGIRVFAKLENQKGVSMLPELLPHADEMIVARGDLGNDMPLWELPAAQKRVAALCRKEGKPFMVVTQLLHSMQHSAVPTRAEVSDVFNAVLDGATSLMLTGETAVGEHPVRAMEYLCKTAQAAVAYQE